jgi:hypothetical protein
MKSQKARSFAVKAITADNKSLEVSSLLFFVKTTQNERNAQNSIIELSTDTKVEASIIPEACQLFHSPSCCRRVALT